MVRFIFFLLIIISMTNTLSYSLAESTNTVMYTQEDFLQYFIDNGFTLRTEDIGMPLFVQYKTNSVIDEILKRFPDYNYISEERVLNHNSQKYEDQTLLCYEIDNDKKILILYSVETRYLTSCLLVCPACKAEEFARIIIGKTTYEQIVEMDPNTCSNIFTSWQQASYHILDNGEYYKITYKTNPDNNCNTIDTISRIDPESAEPLVRLIGLYLDR